MAPRGTKGYPPVPPTFPADQVEATVILMISPDRPVPLHEQVAELLREQIATHQLRGRIPSIRTLAQEYEVSHRTVERALETLKAEGLIVSLIGRGYFVAENLVSSQSRGVAQLGSAHRSGR